MAEPPWPQPLAQPHAAGFTVTEVLVALALSLLLSAGLIQVFLGVRQSYAVNEALARLQEDGRFAIQHLAAIVSLARHDNPNSTGTHPPEPPIGGSASPDTLIIGYEGPWFFNAAEDVCIRGSDGEMYDCLGRCVGPSNPTRPEQCEVTAAEVCEVTASNTFSLDRENTSLLCDAMIGDDVQREVLVGNVEDWRVLYGVDLDGDCVPDRYAPSNALGSVGWSGVRAVRLSLLLRSATEVTPEADTRTYRLLDRTVDAPNDRRLRAVFTATVKLRNDPCSLPAGS